MSEAIMQTKTQSNSDLLTDMIETMCKYINAKAI